MQNYHYRFMPYSQCHFLISPKCQQKVLGQEDLIALAEQEILQCGTSVSVEQFTIERPDPEFFTLLFTFSGTGKVTTQQEEWLLEPGSLLVIPPHIANTIALASEEWQLAWMMLHPTSPLVANILPQIQLLHMPYGELLKNSIDGLVLAQTMPTLAHSKLQPLLVAQMMQVLKASLSEQPIQSRQELRLKQVFEKVEKQLDVNWTVDKMAALAHFSAPHFHRLCKQYYQQSPSQHLIRLRMKHAKRLLSGTDWPIQDIAELVGYPELTNFSARFRKTHHMSPRAFRQQL
ncbi:AraC family transcriptional regulator [Motilimonas cestriensis]|uniref:AraC family transcriptional regulator n=1 Tax=Motilimonas cestriensis TaxID=2742685 RepID=A0ABS8W6I1_9GAMM|nr:AraC family transcriptional regulator [Motilimonas cestriensis]MCE2594599.1 AraC family transcriptional regulator [Motilimonas cestriensis]